MEMNLGFNETLMDSFAGALENILSAFNLKKWMNQLENILYQLFFFRVLITLIETENVIQPLKFKKKIKQLKKTMRLIAFEKRQKN